MNTGYSKTRVMIECAIMIAIGTILAQIQILKMPMGGTVTLASMLPFIVVSYRHGVKWGLLTGFTNSLLQMLLGGIYPPPAGTAIAFAGMILLDYVLAYTVTGFAAVFGKPFKNEYAKIAIGTTIVCALRFLCSFLSGILLWGSYAPEGMNVAVYSLIYNGTYMLPECLITVAVALVLYKIYPALYSAK